MHRAEILNCTKNSTSCHVHAVTTYTPTKPNTTCTGNCEVRKTLTEHIRIQERNGMSFSLMHSWRDKMCMRVLQKPNDMGYYTDYGILYVKFIWVARIHTSFPYATPLPYTGDRDMMARARITHPNLILLVSIH